MKIRHFIAKLLWRLAARLIDLANIICVDPNITTIRSAKIKNFTTIVLSTPIAAPFREGDKILVCKK